MGRTIAFAAALLWCLAVAASAGQGPHIQVAEPRYDFGAVAAGTVLEHVFEVRNTGDEVLILQKVQPS